MCDPLSIAMAGLSAVSSAAEISAQNQASAKNAEMAVNSMNLEYAQTQDEYIERNRSLLQEGFDQVLKGRADQATAYTSALENGVQGNSIKAMLRNSRMKADTNANRYKQEQDSLRRQTSNRFSHITAKAQGRIAAVPQTSFGFGDVASALTPIVKSQM